MNDEWRLTTKSITKYNPIFRDKNGFYRKKDWIGLQDVGKVFDGKLLTFELYLEVEKKYIDASISFFKFHYTNKIAIKNIEKNNFSDYSFEDRENLILLYNDIKEGFQTSIKGISSIIKLILRNLIWAELFDVKSPEIALRFGYDLYMYFNSNRDLKELLIEIEKSGLYVD